MNRHDPRELLLKENTRDTRWITATVALLATLVFAISGSMIMPEIFNGSEGIRSISPQQIAAFLLNIALVMFAWRRSSQLKQTFSERDAWERRAIDLAYRDEVTGIWNRRYLKETFDFFYMRTQGTLVLILVDLDLFKKVNDLHGHEAGDEMLAVSAKRIQQLCPEDAICARLGGDEFAVLLTESPGGIEQTRQLATSMIEALTSPTTLATGEIVIGASIGIARSNEGLENLGDLLRSADVAMYEAKHLGGSRWVEANSQMELAARRRNTMEVEMRAGLARKEFKPFFQPIIDLSSGELKGFEVLARWQHPVKGVIEPPEFLDVATSSGLIATLSLAVMEQALAVALPWPEDVRIAVNVSPVQFKDPLLAQRIIRLLKTTGFPAGRLDLEIAESSLLADHAFALESIRKLKHLGIGIVVDDFGTGYASVTELKTLPFDRLKIDRRFVDAMRTGDQSDALVEAIATLGKGLSVPVSAEGVESRAIRERLVGLGCSDAQGWLFAKALSHDEVDEAFATGSLESRRSAGGQKSEMQAGGLAG